MRPGPKGEGGLGADPARLGVANQADLKYDSPMTPENIATFWNRVDRRAESECWPWLGPLDPNGRGQCYDGKRPMKAHRFSYILNVGTLPDGAIVRHSCKRADCMNPAHLSVDMRGTLPEVERFWANVKKGAPSECWEWTGAHNGNGYGAFSPDSRKLTPAHRYSLELALGRPLGEEYALHACDNKPCVNPAHLRAGTHTDNMADAMERGRMLMSVPRGTAHYQARLTPNQVREVRALCAEGLRYIDVARKTGIERQIVRQIAIGKTWKHVN